MRWDELDGIEQQLIEIYTEEKKGKCETCQYNSYCSTKSRYEDNEIDKEKMLKICKEDFEYDALDNDEYYEKWKDENEHLRKWLEM